MSKTVFVVQRTMRRRDDGSLAPAHNITPAAAYGRLEVLMEGENIEVLTKEKVDDLHERLADFDDSDYLLPIGDPVLIAAACIAAANANNGRIKMLKWDRHAHNYYPVQLDMT